MTKLLESAVARLRDMPEQDQDALALILLCAFDPRAAPELDEASRRAIREGLTQANRGDFVDDAEISALWTRHEV